jgi:hypothetical protein
VQPPGCGNAIVFTVMLSILIAEILYREADAEINGKAERKPPGNAKP